MIEELKIHFLKIKELMSGMKKFRHNIIINGRVETRVET